MSKPPRHHPFRALGARLKARALVPKPSGKSPPADPAVAADAAITFAEAAAQSGVVPLPRAARRVAKGAPARSPTPAGPVTFVVTEDADWLEGYQKKLGPSALRRLRGTPSATLNLHGASIAVAQKELVAFLAGERARGRTLVRVIVGKGRHSPGGHAVLRGELTTWLTSAPLRAQVLAFGTAPEKLGGSGSVLVLLAKAG